MKQKILLLFVFFSFAFLVQAQKSKQKQISAYAITGLQKGQGNWTEVRLVDITTGNEIKTIYQSAQDVTALNARTGNPVVKKIFLCPIFV